MMMVNRGGEFQYIEYDGEILLGVEASVYFEVTIPESTHAALVVATYVDGERSVWEYPPP